MFKELKNQQGLTLIELIVAIGLASIVSLAIYAIFENQNKLYAGENKVVDAQGANRNGISQLSKSFRLIGFDPMESGVSVFGLADSSFIISPTSAITNTTSVYFTADINENGNLDAAEEYIAFRLNGTTLERAVIADALGTISSWAVVAENVSAFTISYFYEDGTNDTASGLPSNMISSIAFEKVRRMMATLTVQTESAHNLTGVVASQTFWTTIQLRNNTGL